MAWSATQTLTIRYRYDQRGETRVTQQEMVEHFKREVRDTVREKGNAIMKVTNVF